MWLTFLASSHHLARIFERRPPHSSSHYEQALRDALVNRLSSLSLTKLSKSRSVKNPREIEGWGKRETSPDAHLGVGRDGTEPSVGMGGLTVGHLTVGSARGVVTPRRRRRLLRAPKQAGGFERVGGRRCGGGARWRGRPERSQGGAPVEEEQKGI